MSATDLTPEYLAEDKGSAVNAAIWSFTAFAGVTLALRAYVRITIKNIFGVDDYVAVLAWVLLVCFCAMDTVAVHLGLGRHLIFLVLNADPADLVDVVFYLWLGNAFAVMANAFAKISFAFTLMRVLPRGWMKHVLWGVIGSLFVINAVLVVLIYAQCEDPRTLWNKTEYPGNCWPTSVLTGFALFAGAYSGAMDFLLASLPWVIIPQLKMKMRDKLGVAFAMSLGMVAGVAAIVKTVQLQTLNSDDATYGQADLVIWGGVEISTTIIASSIPTLRPLGRVLFGGSTTDRYGSGKDSNGIRSSGYKLGRVGGTGGASGHISGDERFQPKSRGMNKTLVTIGSKQSRSKSPGVGVMVLDDDSDKSILGANGNNRSGDIGVAHGGNSMSGSESGGMGSRERGREGSKGGADTYRTQSNVMRVEQEGHGIRTTREVRVQYD